MPTVSLVRSRLLDALPARFRSDDAFDALCFDFGLELDNVTKEPDPASADPAAPAVPTYKIDVPANRYDLLCLEGIVQALRVFVGADRPAPGLRLAAAPAVVIHVDGSTRAVRPYIVGAVLRWVVLGAEGYQSLIDLQEKLHQNICRRRTLVAIGTHDLSAVAAPLRYEAVAEEDLAFRPLRPADRAYGARELLDEVYPQDAQLKKYVAILDGHRRRVPVLRGGDGEVLSMPPIINGWKSRISPQTRDLLVECTATDLTKAHVVLNTIVSMYARYCDGGAVEVEPVRIEYGDAPGGGPPDPETGDPLQSVVTPVLATPRVTATVEYVRRSVGFGAEVGGADMVDMLRRMQLPAAYDEAAGELAVDVPVIRSDVLHACDVMNDVAIAYGFNEVAERMPAVSTVGRQQPLNHLSDLVRREAFAQHGYTEVLTWVTVSHAENFDMLRRADDGKTAVKIGNPKTLEFQECRTSLLPGLLKTLRENRKARVPLRLFEVGDVVLKDAAAEVRAANRRRMAAVYCATAAGFEVVQGLLDQAMRTLGVVRGPAAPGDRTWRLDPAGCTDGALLPKRRANVLYDGRAVGAIGWIHPDVLANFSLSYPCSAFEVDLQAFL
jgi:phenylalanyl-tRNA synthetase beta chain